MRTLKFRYWDSQRNAQGGLLIHQEEELGVGIFIKFSHYVKF